MAGTYDKRRLTPFGEFYPWGAALLRGERARAEESYEAGDDHFDGSEGYRGLNQFMIGMQTTYLTPRAGAGAVRSVGWASGRAAK